jgi:lysozyme
MTTSPRGIALIEQFEGCKLQAYEDVAGVWTIGYGHAGAMQGQYETLAQAAARLCLDVASAERAVSSQVSVPLNQNQFDALVSFTFNEGLGRLQASTMLRLLNAGWYSLAAAEFPKWDIVGGVVSPGLLRRRVAEQALFTEAA